MTNAHCRVLWLSLLLLLFWVAPVTVDASSTSQTITELSGGVERVQSTISGPILKSVAIIALVVGGLMLAFGGELNSTAKTMAQVFLAVGLAGGATSIVKNVFKISGASVVGLSHSSLPALEWLTLGTLFVCGFWTVLRPAAARGERFVMQVLLLLGLSAYGANLSEQLVFQPADPWVVSGGVVELLGFVALVVGCAVRLHGQVSQGRHRTTGLLLLSLGMVGATGGLIGRVVHAHSSDQQREVEGSSACAEAKSGPTPCLHGSWTGTYGTTN